MRTVEHIASAARGAAQIEKSTVRFGAIRRWWIEFTLPTRDSDLTPYEWREVERRWVDAGGDPEELSHIIERNVLE